MRIEPENGIISMMRGDTLLFPIKINEGTKLEPEYRPLRDDEKLYFALMEPGQAFEDAVVKKIYDMYSPKDNDGHTLVKLDTKDTERLLSGTYYYTVKLRTPQQGFDDVVKTLIQPTLFHIYGNNPQSTTSYWDDIQSGEGPETIIFDGGDISSD